MRARFLLVLVVLGALWSGQAASPLPALACSCVMPEPMAAYRGDSSHMILEGRVASVTPTGVEVQVERWFQGPGSATISFEQDGFGDQGAACQDPWPKVGSRWVWVAWVPELGGRPVTNLCTPKAALDTPEGDAMLAAVVSAFGTGRTADPPIESVAESPSGASPSGDLVTIAIVGAVALAALAVFAAVIVIARRREARS